MKTLTQILLLIFTLADAYFFATHNTFLRGVFEPLIIPCLFFYYWISSVTLDIKILLALAFTWIGDLILLYRLDSIDIRWCIFFYWVMQLFFLINYFRYIDRYAKSEHLLGLAFYGSYFYVLMNHVYTSLGDMAIHGIIYALTLSFFGSITLMELLKRVNSTSVLMFTGLLLFSVRDILLTYNDRYFEEEVFTYPIPILHSLGLFLIIKGFLSLEKASQLSH